MQDFERRRHACTVNQIREVALRGPRLDSEAHGKVQWQQEHGRSEPSHVCNSAGFFETGVWISSDYFSSLSSMKLLSIQTRPSSFNAKVSAFSLESFFS